MEPKITPALVPHEEFHTGHWYLPVHRSSWYYFSRKNNPNTITNRQFLDSVDKPLRKLVSWLHNRGIKTTPSCTGHIYSEAELEKVYLELEEDAAQIKNNGLLIRNIETGATFLYQDHQYELPWNKEQFLEEVLEYQKKGVIGLRLHRRLPSHLLARLRTLLRKDVDAISIKETDSILFFFTYANDYRQIKHAWKTITRGIRRVLG